MKQQRGIYEKVSGSGVYYIRYADASGRIRREKAGLKSAAIKLYQKRKTEVLQGKKLPENLRARPISFSELADDALDYSKEHKKSYVDDKVRMAKLKEWIGERSAESLTPQEIEQWLSDKSQRLKSATLNRYRALLSLVYRVGMQNGKVHSNPARLVRQRRENNALLRFLSKEEEDALRTVIREKHLHHEPELDFALNTGLRKSEQYGLTWSMVDFERRVVTIVGSKNGNTRYVYLNDDAISALRELERYKNATTNYVFLSSNGTRLHAPRFWFEPAVKEAKLKNFTWHSLRHTFASRLVMKGIDLRTVQELMGHKSIQMTVRYAHLAPHHQLAAVQRLCDTEATQRDATDTKTDTAQNSTTASADRFGTEVIGVQRLT